MIAFQAIASWTTIASQTTASQTTIASRTTRSLRRVTSHELKLRKAHALGLLTSQANKPDQGFHASDLCAA